MSSNTYRGTYYRNKLKTYLDWYYEELNEVRPKIQFTRAMAKLKKERYEKTKILSELPAETREREARIECNQMKWIMDEIGFGVSTDDDTVVEGAQSSSEEEYESDSDVVFIHSQSSEEEVEPKINRQINQYKFIESGVCCICLEDFKTGDDINELDECLHKFHERCSTNWIKKEKSCPLCRAEILL